MLREEPVAEDVDIKYLARITKGYSGSDLRDVCKRAAVYPIHDFLVEERKTRGRSGSITAQGSSNEGSEKHAIRKMVLADFVAALKEIKPTVIPCSPLHNTTQHNATQHITTTQHNTTNTTNTTQQKIDHFLHFRANMLRYL